MFPAAVERWRALATHEATRWSGMYGVSVPVDSVLALIQTESSGIPSKTRTEPDGRVSRGLLQVLDATAKDLGVSDPQQLYVPAVGIATGVKYFAQKIKRYGGNLTNAIAAYNAGSARFNQDESYRNQGYVDKVRKALADAGATIAREASAAAAAVESAASAAAATVEQAPVPAMAIGLGLMALAALLLVTAPRRGRAA